MLVHWASAEQRALADVLLGAPRRLDQPVVRAANTRERSSFEAEIAAKARAALAGFPADLPPWLVYACGTSGLPPLACGSGLTPALQQFLSPPNEVSIADVNSLVDQALAQAPAALQPLYVAYDDAVLRATSLGDFYLNFLAVRHARPDPQLEAAVSRSLADCFTFGLVCSVDEGQLAMLAIASADLPLPQFLARDFVDCTLSVCPDDEEQAIEAYLQTRIQANAQFQALIEQMRDTTRKVAQGWWRALGPTGG